MTAEPEAVGAGADQDQDADVGQDAGMRADRLLRLLTPEHNGAGTVYGLTMIGAVLAAESYRRSSCGEAFASGAITLFIYWIAHAHATAIGRRIDDGRRGSTSVHSRRRCTMTGRSSAVERSRC